MMEWLHQIDQLPISGLAVLVALMLIIIRYLLNAKDKKEAQDATDQKLEEIYEKENGLFPWEIDSDDDPQNIPMSSKKSDIQKGVERGKWS